MFAMYFTAEEAKRELVKRQNDQELVARIESWQRRSGIKMPSISIQGHLAFFARQIATCRYEDIVFNNIVRAVGLTPVWIEFVEDLFVTYSPYKRSLVHRYYCSGKGRKGGWKINKRSGIKVDVYDGKPMSTICRTNGQSLVDYHHMLQDKYLDNPIRYDLSAYLKSFGASHEFYLPFLSMFLLRGVLVDDYHAENYHNGVARDTDIAFTRNVFEPAWKKIVEETGIQPIIMPLPWTDGMQFFPQEGHDSHCVIDCDDIFRQVV